MHITLTCKRCYHVVIVKTTVIVEPVPLFPSSITSYSSDSPLCSSVTPSLFHSRLKNLFHKSFPRSFTSPPPSGLSSRTITRTVSSELLGLCFQFFLITGPPTHSIGGGRLVTVAGVCRRLSSSSVTLHGRPAGGGQAMTSSSLQSNYCTTVARRASRFTSC